MVDLACEHRFESVAISHVVARARVSSRTFYELFEDRNDCLLAAIEHGLELAGACAREGYDSRSRWLDRIREGLLALLSFFDEEPRLARLTVVRSAAAGPEALSLRARILEQLAQVVDEGRADVRGEPPLLTAEAVVGGVLSVIHSRLLKPDAGPLVELLGPLMSMIVLPYHGAAAARRELARPAPAPRALAQRALSAHPPVGSEVRMTSRTLAVLKVVASHPGLSNKEVAERAGIADQGQTSRLLGRLCERGLMENTGGGQPMGAANAWRLTRKGERLEQAVSSGVRAAPR